MSGKRYARVAELVDALDSGFDFVGLQGVAGVAGCLFFFGFSLAFQGLGRFWRRLRFGRVAGLGWFGTGGGHGGGH